MNKIILGDARNVLKKLEDNSIDTCLTDPPYFLDKLDNEWNHENVSSKKNHHVVKSLPAGMKFDRKQGINFYNWYLDISKEIYRVLKPGGFFFSFSSPRLYHRMACAMDDAGFEIRDCFLWIYTQNQMKAMSLSHVIKKMDILESDKEKLINCLKGWKTPQIKSCFEPIGMGQKPTDGTYLNNIIEHEVGLFNTNIRVGENMYPSNILTIPDVHESLERYFLINKPTKNDKGEYNNHVSVKPVPLCEHIIELSMFNKNGVVLDPFLGSGTTALAAKNLGRNFIGIEVNETYIEIAKRRLIEKS